MELVYKLKENPYGSTHSSSFNLHYRLATMMGTIKSLNNKAGPLLNSEQNWTMLIKKSMVTPKEQ